MYESWYGFTEKPFNLTPDPKYLYLSQRHAEAFAHLEFGHSDLLLRGRIDGKRWAGYLVPAPVATGRVASLPWRNHEREIPCHPRPDDAA